MLEKKKLFKKFIEDFNSDNESIIKHPTFEAAVDILINHYIHKADNPIEEFFFDPFIQMNIIRLLTEDTYAKAYIAIVSAITFVVDSTDTKKVILPSDADIMYFKKVADSVLSGVTDVVTIKTLEPASGNVYYKDFARSYIGI